MLHQEEKVYLPETNQRYWINKKGEVFDNEKIVQEIITDEGIFIQLDWYGGNILYRYDCLPVLCFFKIKIPKEDLSKIRLIFKDGNKENKAISNLAYYFKEPVESKEYPGYFYVPYYTGYVINTRGETISLDYMRLRKIFKHKKWTISKPVFKKNIVGGYYCGRGKRDHDGVNGASRHRFLALTFIPYKNDPLELTVNHKNGIPGDDRLNNLEWMTYSENIKHAYKNSLYKTKSVSVLVLDEVTGIETRYSTIAECSEKTGLSYGCIYSRLEKPFIKYTGEIRIKRDDGTPWPVTVVERKPTFNRSVMAKNVFTENLIIFNSIVEAEEYTGVNRATISYHCDNELYSPTMGYNFRYTNIGVIWPSFTKYHLRMYQRHPVGFIPNGLFLLDESGNIKQFYETFEDFTKETGFGESKIRSIIKNCEKWNGLSLRKFDARAAL